MPLEAASRVSGKAVAIAAIVASALTAAAAPAAAAAAAAFTVGGCWEGTVRNDCRERTAARRQVPWIRKLGQASGIGGAGCRRTNQRPLRAPVSSGGRAEPPAPGAVLVAAAATAKATAAATHARMLTLAHTLIHARHRRLRRPAHP